MAMSNASPAGRAGDWRRRERVRLNAQWRVSATGRDVPGRAAAVVAEGVRTGAHAAVRQPPAAPARPRPGADVARHPRGTAVGSRRRRTAARRADDLALAASSVPRQTTLRRSARTQAASPPSRPTLRPSLRARSYPRLRRCRAATPAQAASVPAYQLRPRRSGRGRAAPVQSIWRTPRHFSPPGVSHRSCWPIPQRSAHRGRAAPPLRERPSRTGLRARLQIVQAEACADARVPSRATPIPCGSISSRSASAPRGRVQPWPPAGRLDHVATRRRPEDELRGRTGAGSCCAAALPTAAQGPGSRCEARSRGAGTWLVWFSRTREGPESLCLFGIAAVPIDDGGSSRDSSSTVVQGRHRRLLPLDRGVTSENMTVGDAGRRGAEHRALSRSAPW